MEPCPNCGQPVRATARFCTSCGYRIPERPQGSTSAHTTTGFASTWIESDEVDTPVVEHSSEPATTWPATPEPPAASQEVQWAPPVTIENTETGIVAAPPTEVVPDPLDEIVAATAGFNSEEESIADRSQNQINIALYHVETLRQLLPGLSNWSEERAQSVNAAIAAMEAAIAGREADDSPFDSLRQTIVAAKKDPRDIDVMIALSDRATDIEDLLLAHDKYSIGIRQALIDLKPLAVEYVSVPKARRAPARKSTSTRSRSTASKSTSSTASKTSTTSTRKPAASSTTSKSTGTTRTRKTTTTESDS